VILRTTSKQLINPNVISTTAVETSLSRCRRVRGPGLSTISESEFSAAHQCVLWDSILVY
jgi:hypothetical protein